MSLKREPETVFERPLWRSGRCGEIKVYLNNIYGSGFLSHLALDSFDRAVPTRPYADVTPATKRHRMRRPLALSST